MDDHVEILLGLAREYQSALAAITRDPNISEEEKRQRVGAVVRDFEAKYEPERNRILEHLQTDYERLRSRAYPPKDPGAHDLDQLQEDLRQATVGRLEEMWAGGDEAIIEGYLAELERGNDLHVEVYELHAGDRIRNPELRKDFAERAEDNQLARMPEERRRAMARFKEFARHRRTVEYLMLLQDQGLVLARLSGALQPEQ